jgi:hypothetical protein
VFDGITILKNVCQKKERIMKKKIFILAIALASMLFISPHLDARDYTEDLVWEHRLLPTNRFAYSFDLSPDETKIAISYSSQNPPYSNFEIRSTETGEILKENITEEKNFCLVHYSNDNNYVYFSSKDPNNGLNSKFFKVNIETMEFELLIDDIPGAVHTFDISHDEKRVVVGTGDVLLYDLSTGQLLETREKSISLGKLKFTPDDNKILAKSAGATSQLAILDANTLKNIHVIQGLDKFKDFALSPNGDYVATTCEFTTKDCFRVYDVESVNTLFTIDSWFGQFWCLTFSNDNKYVAGFRLTDGIDYISIETGESIYKMDRFHGFSDMMFSKDNQYIYCLSDYLFKFRTPWHPSSVDDVSFDYDETIYPNPTSGSLILELNSQISEELHIELYAQQGEIVFEMDHFLQEGVNQIPIDVSELIPGMYFVRIVSTGGSRVHKFVKLL